MTLAVGFWVLLAGGVMLPGSNDPLAVSAPINSQYYTVPLNIPSWQSTWAMLQIPGSGDSRNASGRGYNVPGRSIPGQPYRPGSYPRTVSTMPRIMPLSPTDPGTTGYMPAPPTMTGNMPLSPMGRIRPGFSGSTLANSRMPSAFSGLGKMPTAPYGGGSSFTSMESAGGMAPPARFGVAGNPSTQEKAFNRYHQASAVSPYYGLYSANTQGGTVDPFTSTVLPRLQQEQQNTQFNNDINTLQNQYQLVAPEQNANRAQGDSSGNPMNYSGQPGNGP